MDYADWIEIYKDSAGDWRWSAKAGNGKTVADSGEGYKNKVDMENAVANLFPNVEVRPREVETE